ncbi:hypothetical protein YTPLAS18_30480 [Nitrospira sp.]|nr:hypothetical protein YTPLAS18_30480 [Nitrospira sp.]
MRFEQWRRSLRILCIGLLCFGVFMQVLGVPSSMWCLEVPEDPFEGQILEDLSIPTWKELVSFSVLRMTRSYPSSRAPDMLAEGLLFRPPCCAATS